MLIVDLFVTFDCIVSFFDRAKRVSKKLLSFEWRKTGEEERTTLTCSKAYSSRQSEMKE